MRLLFLLLAPVMGFAQLETTITYQSKEVHAITTKADGKLSWKIDTIKYHVPFDIKITKAKVSIDGYGTYKITEYKDKSHEGTAIHYYRLADKSTFTLIDKIVYWEYPFENKRSKIIIFVVD